MEEEIPKIKSRLRRHESRLSKLEENLSSIPRIEDKLDRLLDKELPVNMEIKHYQIETLQKEVKILRATVSDLENKVRKYSIPLTILTLIVVSAAISAILGVDISAVI